LGDDESAFYFTKNRGELFISMIAWISEQMYNREREVDRITLAALAHLAIVGIYCEFL
jgi:hypothetical protein